MLLILREYMTKLVSLMRKQASRVTKEVEEVPAMILDSTYVTKNDFVNLYGEIRIKDDVFDERKNQGKEDYI